MEAIKIADNCLLRMAEGKEEIDCLLICAKSYLHLNDPFNAISCINHVSGLEEASVIKLAASVLNGNLENIQGEVKNFSV